MLNSDSQVGDPGEFELDVKLVEVVDLAGMVNLTDDGCGSTCAGACASAV